MAIHCRAVKNSLHGTQSNHLFILLLQAETEMRHFTQKLHVQIENKPRSPRSEIII
jgi:hypothetical protein